MNTISLLPEERTKLFRLERQVTDKKTVKRIQAILTLDSGYSIKQVAEVLLLDEDTITKIKKKYDKGQFSDWLKNAYKGYTGKLTKEQEEDIDRHVQESLITDCR